MVDKWVNVKNWDEFEIGMKIKRTLSGEEYEITSVGTGKFDLNVQDKWGKTGLGFQRQQFKSYDWQRLETTAPEEEAPIGSWEPLDSWDELYIGAKMKGAMTDTEYTVVEKDPWLLRSKNGSQEQIDDRNEVIPGVKIWVESWVESKTSSADDFLRAVFAKPKQRYTPKKISDHPHTCWNCNSPSYNSDNTVYCSNPYCRFGKKKS